MLFAEAKIDPNLDWETLLSFLNDTQRRALEDAIPESVQASIRRAPPQECLLLIKGLKRNTLSRYVEAILSRRAMLPAMLKLLPENDRLPALQALPWNKIWQHDADRNDYQSILDVLDGLSPADRAYLILDSILTLAPTNIRFVETFLSELSDEELFAIIVRTDSKKLMISAPNYLSVFKIFYSRIPQEKWFEAMKDNYLILLNAAINNAENIRFC